MSLIFAMSSLFSIIPVISVVAGRITSVRIVSSMMAAGIVFRVTVSSELVNVMSAKTRGEGIVIHNAPWAMELR
jgi:hypothetical protein